MGPRGRPRHQDRLTPAEWRAVDAVRHGLTNRTVKDLAKAESRYRDVLGLAHLYTFGNLAFFDCGGTRLMLSQNEEPQKEESLLYLRVGDIHAAYPRLQALGVEFVGAPHMIHRHVDGTEERMAFFKGLEGRHLAIMAAARGDE